MDHSPLFLDQGAAREFTLVAVDAKQLRRCGLLGRWERLRLCGCVSLLLLLGGGLAYLFARWHRSVPCDLECNAHGKCAVNANSRSVHCDCANGWDGEGCEHPTGCELRNVSLELRNVSLGLVAPCLRSRGHWKCVPAHGSQHSCECEEGWFGTDCDEVAFEGGCPPCEM